MGEGAKSKKIMNTPASSAASGSRKRPFAATCMATGSRRGAIDVGIIINSDPKKPGDNVYQRSDVGSDTGGDSIDSNEDIPEITNLRNALDYLVSVKDTDTIYNGSEINDNNQQQTSKESQSTRLAAAASNNNVNKDEQEKRKEDPQLYKIPNLVNSILMEHHSSNRRQRDDDKKSGQESDDATHATETSSHAMRSLSRIEKEQITQLLIAIIVEFSEPYFAQMARHQQLERAKLLLMQQAQKQAQQQTQEILKAKGRSKNRPQNDVNKDATQKDQSRLPDFHKRAVSWATSCLTQLLQLPPSATPINKGYVTRTNKIHIPELDALLAASGPHDGLEFERQMQSALLCGFQGRQLLQDKESLE